MSASSQAVPAVKQRVQSKRKASRSPLAKSRGGRLTQSQIQQRTRRVLKIASESFIANGFKATSLEFIASRAKVAKRTLYQQYGGKKGLFVAVIRQRAEEIGHFEPVRMSSLESIQVTLQHAARRLLVFCLAPHTVRYLQLIIAESVRFPQLMQNVMQESVTTLYESLAELFRDGASRGLLRISDPIATAKIFADLIVGLSLLHICAGLRTTTPTDEELNEKIRIFLKAHQAP